jgi:pyruvate dehydrogenase E2 component (dihydrolipoamide acetyltransferase)
MATDVTMPRLSDSMEEGTVLKWLVDQGGEVKRGEPLVEIETDKANMTYEADTDGTLIEIVAGEGDTLAIGEVIARARPRRTAAGGPSRAPRRRAPTPRLTATSPPPPGRRVGRPSRSPSRKGPRSPPQEVVTPAEAGRTAGPPRAAVRAPARGDRVAMVASRPHRSRGASPRSAAST